jgi:triosephosphate isomerase
MQRRMSSRIPFVVGNWKLHKTRSEAAAFIAALRSELAELLSQPPARNRVQLGIAPVFTALQTAAEAVRGSELTVAAQDCFWEARGAFTGEVSPALLADAGASWVIIGHSERRQHFGERDEHVARKARAALDAGLGVIVCVGETEGERDQGHTEARVTTQVNAALAEIGKADVDRLVIAYEPVWAIGTGRTATPAQAQEVHALIRGLLRQHLADLASQVRIQYGGSVKPGNAEELLREPDIDGALVGGASLEVRDFAAIARAAVLARSARIG